MLVTYIVCMSHNSISAAVETVKQTMRSKLSYFHQRLIFCHSIYYCICTNKNIWVFASRVSFTLPQAPMPTLIHAQTLQFIDNTLETHSPHIQGQSYRKPQHWNVLTPPPPKKTKNTTQQLIKRINTKTDIFPGTKVK